MSVLYLLYRVRVMVTLKGISTTKLEDRVISLFMVVAAPMEIILKPYNSVWLNVNQVNLIFFFAFQTEWYFLSLCYCTVKILKRLAFYFLKKSFLKN